MPTKAQFQRVIDLMYTILPLTFEREDSLRMMETRVFSPYYQCGTVHCFGGWFAVALLQEKQLDGNVSYNKGADKMAEMLGFKNSVELKGWAESKKKLWGNEHGHSMFCYEDAFRHPTRRPHGAQTVADIINHLEEVQSRLPE